MRSADLAQVAPNRKCWNITYGADSAVDHQSGRKTDHCYGGMLNQTILRPLYAINVLAFFYRHGSDILGALAGTVGFRFTLKQYQTVFALAVFKTLRPAEVVSPAEMIRIAGAALLRISPTYPEDGAVPHQIFFFVPPSFPEDILASLLTVRYNGAIFVPFVLHGESQLEGLMGLWRQIVNLPSVMRGELDSSKAIMVSHIYSILQILLTDIPNRPA